MEFDLVRAYTAFRRGKEVDWSSGHLEYPLFLYHIRTGKWFAWKTDVLMGVGGRLNLSSCVMKIGWRPLRVVIKREFDKAGLMTLYQLLEKLFIDEQPGPSPMRLSCRFHLLLVTFSVNDTTGTSGNVCLLDNNSGVRNCTAFKDWSGVQVSQPPRRARMFSSPWRAAHLNVLR